MKICRACKVAKPPEDFHKASKTPDGLQYRCKVCSISAARQRAIDNPEAKRAADRKYSASGKSKVKRKARREGPKRETILRQKSESWYRNHESNLEKLREREGDPEFRRKQKERYARWRAKDPRGVQRTSLRILYGLTLEQWDGMVVAQSGRCAICARPTPDLHVDHCHATGVVRGLLCANCNRGLGLFADDPSWLLTAAQYVMKYKARDA